MGSNKDRWYMGDNPWVTVTDKTTTETYPRSSRKKKIKNKRKRKRQEKIAKGKNKKPIVVEPVKNEGVVHDWSASASGTIKDVTEVVKKTSYVWGVIAAAVILFLLSSVGYSVMNDRQNIYFKGTLDWKNPLTNKIERYKFNSRYRVVVRDCTITFPYKDGSLTLAVKQGEYNLSILRLRRGKDDK